jgi:hypothetical protein
MWGMAWKGSAAFAVVAAMALGSGSARAASSWQEMHETSDDVRVEVGPDGVGTVQHHLRYRIVAGRFKTFDVVGVDPRAELSPEAVMTPEKGGEEILARVEPVPKTPGTMRILIDEDKGVGRGAYVVDVKYRLDFVGTKMLTRDGAMWKLAWTAPPTPEGHDGARVIFDIPSAPTEPRLAAAADSTTTLTTLRRAGERDELELVRTHVPRGEAVLWAARVDPKAFPRVTSPELRPPAPPDTAPPSFIASHVWSALVALGFALLSGALASLLRAKQTAVRASALRRGGQARRLVPLPWGVAPFAYGIVASGALAVLLWHNPTLGAVLVVVAAALACHRAPLPIARPRGPGAWKKVSDRMLLAARAPSPLPTDGLDLGSRRGRIVFAAIVGLVVAAVAILRLRVPQIALALPISAVALLPIFSTGTRSQMPPAPAEVAARLLRPARDALASVVDLTHIELATTGRVIRSTGSSSADIVDELRLTCVPRDRTPGLRAIELALAIGPCGAALPEVFLRFDDASAAAERIVRLAPGAPTVCGRTTEERVTRLAPQPGTPEAAAALVGCLLLSLEGRRASDRQGPDAHARWTGPERRGRILAPAGAAALC